MLFCFVLVINGMIVSSYTLLSWLLRHHTCLVRGLAVFFYMTYAWSAKAQT